MPRHRQTIQTPSGVHLWLVLWKAHDAVREYASANIASLGLRLTDFAILELLLHKGPLPVNAAGAKVGLTSGSMTIAVDRLEARGLVERRSAAADRRERVVHLTSEGRRLIECAFGAHARAMERLARIIPAQDRRRLLELLKKLGLAAQEMTQQAARG